MSRIVTMTPTEQDVTASRADDAAPDVSIVVPVLDERDALPELIDEIDAALAAGGRERELIFVDDGSTDAGRSLLDPLPRDDVRVIVHPTNRGKGAAVKTGLEAATGDILCIQDADLEYDPREYERLLQPIRDGLADVVFGSRFLGGPHRVLFFWHYAGNRLLTLLSNMTTNLNLTDMETGYKAFRTEILKSLRLTEEKFGIEPEITGEICKRALRVYEMPISYFGRTYAEGKNVSWRDGFRAVYVLFRTRLRP